MSKRKMRLTVVARTPRKATLASCENSQLVTVVKCERAKRAAVAHFREEAVRTKSLMDGVDMSEGDKENSNDEGLLNTCEASIISLSLEKRLSPSISQGRIQEREPPRGLAPKERPTFQQPSRERDRGSIRLSKNKL